MSIKFHFENTVTLCTLSWLEKHFGRYNIRSNQNCILNKIFDVRTPFLMDGEAQKISVSMSDHFNENGKRISLEQCFSNMGKKKKKKSIQVLSALEEQNITFITDTFCRLREDSQFQNLFDYDSSPDDYKLNNCFIRKARDKFFTCACNQFPNMEGSNLSSDYILHESKNHKYLIPPKCRYIVGDVFDLELYFKEDRFDVVVIDPPWQNKHIKRKRKSRGLPHSYNTMAVDDVLKIPLARILSQDALVLIWITNSSKINEEFQDSLHEWDLELITTWFWLKVTKSGDPVVNLDTTFSKGKLPYEKLLITQKRSDNIYRKRPHVPKNLIICSVPSGFHSHKPSLQEVILHYLNKTESSKCLELFARSLTPGWTSLGKEVLLLQDLFLLEDT